MLSGMEFQSKAPCEHMLRRGSKSFGGLRRGVKKGLTTKIFNCPAPHQSIYEHSLKASC